MIDMDLLNFGVLGLWTASLVREKLSSEKKSDARFQSTTKTFKSFEKTINKLTKAINNKL